jgi:hypothetical protein
MQRRSFIMAAAATALGGCLASAPTDEEPTGTPTDSPRPTPTGSPEPTAHGPELVETSFEVTGVECGGPVADHEVTMEDGRVTVEGTLDGSDGCHSAELVRGAYDRVADTLYVDVEAVTGDDADVCTQCIVEIDYVATFEFEGGEPGAVEVDQRGAVSGSSSESGSASATPGDGTEAPTPKPDDYRGSGRAFSPYRGTPSSV